MEKQKILIADDSEMNRALLVDILEDQYDIVEADNGAAAIDLLTQCGGNFSLLLLDIMMPGINGLEVLKKLRSAGNKTPVLLLTALDSVPDRVAGLDGGADDYLVKPFAFEELLARIRAMLRREGGRPDNCYRIADLVVDCDARTAARGSMQITLSSKEFSILEYLICNQGIVLTREKIEQHIWNYDYEGGSNVVDVYIRYLRKKIDDGFSPKLIHTVRGVGYVLKEA